MPKGGGGGSTKKNDVVKKGVPKKRTKNCLQKNVGQFFNHKMYY